MIPCNTSTVARASSKARCVGEGPRAIRERIAAVHEQPAPAKVQRKVRGVALGAVLDTELDEGLVRRADLGKEVKQQAVLAELRVNLALVVGEELAFVRRVDERRILLTQGVDLILVTDVALPPGLHAFEAREVLAGAGPARGLL